MSAGLRDRPGRTRRRRGTESHRSSSEEITLATMTLGSLLTSVLQLAVAPMILLE
jgi:hypothetical protein